MNEAQIDDLKQFISVTVSQAVADLPTRTEMNQRFEEVDKRFDEVITATGDTIGGYMDQVDRWFDNHNKRIKKLERKTA